MNSTLLLANAIALAVLVGFHFVPESAEPVGSAYAALLAGAESAAVGGVERSERLRGAGSQ